MELKPKKWTSLCSCKDARWTARCNLNFDLTFDGKLTKVQTT